MSLEMNCSGRKMLNNKASKAKLLFLISNDFGELSNAMYLVKGYNFQTVILMPKRLFSINQNSLSILTYCYHSIHDVTRIAAQEKPDIVFLFSGYLYSINDIFSIETVENLIDELKNKCYKIITSDPFLGILSRLDTSTFSDRHPKKQLLIQHFSRVFAILKNITHLYLINLGSSASIESVSFFNQNIIVPQSWLIEYEKMLTQWTAIHPTKRRWLFVLSLEDYGNQISLHGRAKFDEILLDKLHQTVRADRQPILVAPGVCIESIRNRSSTIANLVLLPYCGYNLFMLLLFNAEYVFYWNIFSNSILARVMNHLPVFFFAPGHMVYAIKPLFEIGMKSYYSDSALVYLNQERELVSEELKSIAANLEQIMNGARKNFRQSPTPEEMVTKMLQS
jgi:hypothetical protein